jgi:hypothetical protein
VLAGTSTTATTATATIAAAGVGIEQLASSGLSVIQPFEQLGVLAGLVAVNKLLVDLTKFGPIGKWMKEKNLKWVRPALSVIGALLLGVSTALAMGTNVGMAIVNGLLVGLATPGLHELIEMLRGRHKARPQEALFKT